MRTPSPELVDRFAARLRYAKAFFFYCLRWGSTTSCAYYRKRKSASLHDIRQALAIANVRRIQISRLLIAGDAELSPEKQFRRFDIEEHPGGPANIARTVRVMWCLPPGPI